MSAIPDIFSIRSHLGFIWDKLSGAGKNIMKTISDNVIIPMKRSWKSRGPHRHHTVRKEIEQQTEPSEDELDEDPVNVWQPVPWQPLPWNYYLPTIATSTTAPTEPTTVTIKRKKKSRLIRCRGNDNNENSSRRCLRRRKSARQDSTTAATTLPTTTRKLLTTTTRRQSSDNESTSHRSQELTESTAWTTTSTTFRTTTKKSLEVKKCKNNTNGASLRGCRRRRRPAHKTTTIRSTTATTITTTVKKSRASKRCQNKSSSQRCVRRKKKTTVTTTTLSTTTKKIIVVRKCQKNNKNEPPSEKCQQQRKTTRPSTKLPTTIKPIAARRCQNSKNGPSLHLRQIVSRTPKITTKKSLTTSKLKSLKKEFHPILISNQSNGICKTCTCADSAVDCSNKKIKPFDLIAWKGLVSFKPIIMDLSQNPLKSITRFPKLPIQMLNLSNCHIHHFETSALTALEELTTLDLSYNRISATDLKDLSMPLDYFKAPRPFKRMQDLSLAHNAIYSLPQSMFKFMNNLTFLDLSDNPLAYIDSGTKAAISSLMHLRHLVLSSCELESLPIGLLKNQKKLRWLDLSNNRFTTVPLVLQEVPKLLFLSLERNPITNIDTKGPITKLTSLEELHLSHMSRLQNITAGGIGGLVKLDILRLNHNPRLTNLDPEFLIYRDEDQVPYWPTLRELHLNNNNLSTINSQFLDDWYDLTDGDFSNNPYVCDCDNQWMVNVLTPLVQSLPQKQTIYQMRFDFLLLLSKCSQSLETCRVEGKKPASDPKIWLGKYISSNEDLPVGGMCNEPENLKGVTFAYMSRTSKVFPCSELKGKEEHSILLISLGTMAGALVSVPFIIIFVIMLWKRFKKRRKRDDVHIQTTDIDEQF